MCPHQTVQVGTIFHADSVRDLFDRKIAFRKQRIDLLQPPGGPVLSRRDLVSGEKSAAHGVASDSQTAAVFIQCFLPLFVLIQSEPEFFHGIVGRTSLIFQKTAQQSQRHDLSITDLFRDGAGKIFSDGPEAFPQGRHIRFIQFDHMGQGKHGPPVIQQKSPRFRVVLQRIKLHHHDPVFPVRSVLKLGLESGCGKTQTGRRGVVRLVKQISGGIVCTPPLQTTDI